MVGVTTHSTETAAHGEVLTTITVGMAVGVTVATTDGVGTMAGTTDGIIMDGTIVAGTTMVGIIMVGIIMVGTTTAGTTMEAMVVDQLDQTRIITVDHEVVLQLEVAELQIDQVCMVEQ